MLSSIITSKTRIKILMKFFLNPNTSSYLRELTSELNESSNGVRVISEKKGRLVKYKANQNHRLFDELSSLVKKFTGVDQVIDRMVAKLGDVKSAYLIGDYARGVDSGIVDILLVGDIDMNSLNHIAGQRGKQINKVIRTIVLKKKQVCDLWDQLNMDQSLLIWGKGIKK